MFRFYNYYYIINYNIYKTLHQINISLSKTKSKWPAKDIDLKLSDAVLLYFIFYDPHVWVFYFCNSKIKTKNPKLISTRGQRQEQVSFPDPPISFKVLSDFYGFSWSFLITPFFKSYLGQKKICSSFGLSFEIMQLLGCLAFFNFFFLTFFVISHTIGCRINTSLTSRTGGRKCERGVAGRADNKNNKYITLNGGNFHSTIVRNTNKNNNNTHRVHMQSG